MTERLKPNGQPYKTKWYKPVENDKRKTNGNNGTRRGTDKVKRKAAPKRKPDFKPEVLAGLTYRMNLLIKYHGGTNKLAAKLKINGLRMVLWKQKGYVPNSMLVKIQLMYNRERYTGYSANFCRPDLKLDIHGRVIGERPWARQKARIAKKNPS